MDEELTPDEELTFDLPESEELDEYGVWVKSDPEDLTDQPESTPSVIGLDEIEEPDGFLTDEEEDLLGDLERRADDEPVESALSQGAEDEVMSINEPEDLTAKSQENDELSIDLPDLGELEEDQQDSPELDSDALQKELDSINLDDLGDSEEISIDFSDVEEEEDERFLEEEGMHLDLDSESDEIDLSDSAEEEESELDDLQIPGLDDLDSLGESDFSGSSSSSQDEQPAGDDSEEISIPSLDTLDGDDFEAITIDDGTESLDSTDTSSESTENDEPPSAQEIDLDSAEEIELEDVDTFEDLRDRMETDPAADDDASAETNVQIPDLDDEFLEIGDESLESDSLPSLEESSLPELDDDYSIDEMDALSNLREDTDFSAEDDSVPDALGQDSMLDEIDEPDFTETLPELGDFDDVNALTQELSADNDIEPDDQPQISVLGTPTARDNSDRSENVHVDAGSSMLSAIESELSAIRSELISLRSELKDLRSAPAAPATTAVAEAIPEDEAFVADETFEAAAMAEDDSKQEEEVAAGSEEDEHGGGFFDDEEDETIALTGDELDNILNTAEFTEEAGKPSEIEEDSFEPEETLAQEELPGLEISNEGAEETVIDGDLDSEEALLAEEVDSPESPESPESGEVSEISLEEINPQDEGMLEHDPFQGSEAEVQAMAELDIEKELAGIDDLDDDSLQVDFDESELEKMSIDIPDSFSEEEDSPIRELPDGFEPDLSAEESEMLQDSIDNDYQNTFPEDTELGPLADSDNPEAAEALADAETELALTSSGELGSEEAADPEVSDSLKHEIKSVLAYMDKLLEALPEEKIEEFARSEHFEVYKRLFEELGL